MSVHLQNVNPYGGMSATKMGECMCVGVGQFNELTVNPLGS